MAFVSGTPFLPSELDRMNAVMMSQSDLIQNKIHQQVLPDAPWTIGLVNQVEWPDGVGDTGRVPINERAKVEGVEWEQVTLDSQSFDRKAWVLQTNVTMRNFYRYRTSIVSESVDLEWVRQRHLFREQVQNISDQLAANVQYTWSDWLRDNYCELASQKIVVTAGALIGLNPDQDTTTMPEVLPEGILTAGIMDRVHNVLTLEGAGNGGSVGTANGFPIYTAFVARETLDYILKNPDYDREDIRYSPESGSLLANWGVKKAYKNFVYINDPFAPRYDFDPDAAAGSKWRRISPYILKDTTIGKRAMPNPAYEQAPFVDTIIFTKNVFECMVPQVITNIAGATFKPQDYRGTVRWINIQDRERNWQGTVGNFVATMDMGRKPKFVRQGAVIRHVRAWADANIYSANGTKIGNMNTGPVTGGDSGL